MLWTMPARTRKPDSLLTLLTGLHWGTSTIKSCPLGGRAAHLVLLKDIENGLWVDVHVCSTFCASHCPDSACSLECVPFAMLSCAGHTCGLTNWTCSRSWRNLTRILSVHDLQILLQASPCRVLRLLEKGWHLLAPNPLYLCITITCETLQRESL